MKRILTLWLLLAGVALAQSWYTLKEEGFQNPVSFRAEEDRGGCLGGRPRGELLPHERGRLRGDAG